MSGGKLRAMRFDKVRPRTITCRSCNGLGGGLDDDGELEECPHCLGNGEVRAL